MESWKRNNSLRRVRENDHEKRIYYFDFIEEFSKLSNKYSDLGIKINFNDIFVKDNPIELHLSFEESELKIKDEYDIEEAKITTNNLMRALKDCENFKYLGYEVRFA